MQLMKLSQEKFLQAEQGFTKLLDNSEKISNTMYTYTGFILYFP